MGGSPLYSYPSQVIRVGRGGAGFSKCPLCFDQLLNLCVATNVAKCQFQTHAQQQMMSY